MILSKIATIPLYDKYGKIFNIKANMHPINGKIINFFDSQCLYRKIINIVKKITAPLLCFVRKHIAAKNPPRNRYFFSFLVDIK